MIDKSVKKQNDSLHQFSSEIKVFSSRPDHSIAQEKPFIISRHLTTTKTFAIFYSSIFLIRIPKRVLKQLFSAGLLIHKSNSLKSFFDTSPSYYYTIKVASRKRKVAAFSAGTAKPQTKSTKDDQ